MYCNQCGTNNADDARYCQKCGKQLGTKDQDSPTVASSPPTQASTYDSSPYGSDVYSLTQLSTPLPPPPPQHRARFSLIVGIVSGVVVSILILGSVGVFVLLTQKAKSTSTLSTAVPSEKCSGAFSDEFNGNINSRWQWVNPIGNATYDVTAQGLLRISISAPSNNDLYALTNHNAPRLLQPISGNFTVETLVEFNPIYSFQGAGILIWQDDANFLRFEQVYNGGNGFLFAKEEKGVWSDIGSIGNHLTIATQVGLRVQMEGDHLTAWWHGPGQDWQNDGGTTMPFANAKIGLILAANYSQGASQTTAYYDYFRVTCI